MRPCKRTSPACGGGGSPDEPDDGKYRRPVFIGALTFSIIGYFSAKSGKNKIAKQFVPVVLPEETADAAPEETPEATE